MCGSHRASQDAHATRSERRPGSAALYGKVGHDRIATPRCTRGARCFARPCFRGVADPRGLFFHAFDGAASGTEWSTWAPSVGANRYEFADVSAQGLYTATFAPDGTFVFDSGRGTGAFSNPDSAMIQFTLPGNTIFHSNIRRAPYTDDRFPVLFTTAVAGDPSLTGSWSARIIDVDPSTGDTLSERAVTVDLVVDDTTIRVTTPEGTFFQGTWIADDQAAFRIVSPAPLPSRYRTFPGSETNADLDTLGDLRLLDDGSITLSLFFQTRTPFPTQQQTMQHFVLTPAPTPGVLAPISAAALLATRRRR